MVDQIHKRKHNVMLGIIHRIFGSLLIFFDSVCVPELLNKGCELTLDIASQHVLWQLSQSFNLHGA